MLQGKTALVTGSTSGIGLGIAKSLARQGANIVLNGFGDAEGPKAEIAALGVQVAYHGADMSQASEIEAMMAFAADTFGRVDILVNNAGIQHVARIENFPVERWDAILAINLSGEGEYNTYFLKIDNCKFKQMVKPGDTLLLKMELSAPIRRGICEMKGTVYVGGKVCAEADLVAQIVKK